MYKAYFIRYTCTCKTGVSSSKQSHKSRSVLQDGSRFLGLFWKRETYPIAYLHTTDLSMEKVKFPNFSLRMRKCTLNSCQYDKISARTCVFAHKHLRSWTCITVTAYAHEFMYKVKGYGSGDTYKLHLATKAKCYWTDARRPIPRLWIRSAKVRGERHQENRNTTTTKAKLMVNAPNFFHKYQAALNN